ncbi:MAG: VWA domain-containing protein [Bryobacteraceae bacterium]
MGRLSFAALISFGLALPAPAQEPVFRSDVNLVRLIVTVKDAAGGLVTDANRDDFTVSDNGVKQTVSVFERHTEQPLSVSLLIDTSGSTGIELRHEVDSLLHFVTALFREGNPNDAAALYSFDTDVTLHSSFTRRIPRLEHELQGLESGAGTSMYDALWLAARDLEGREGRHIVVIVTDGGDTTSAKDFHAALESVQLAEASVYPVVIIPITNDAGRNIGGEHALTTIAQRTGGRIFLPSTGAELENAFVELVHELRTQYLLGYYPKNVPPSANRFHSTTVKLARPGLRAITRTGYYGNTDR